MQLASSIGNVAGCDAAGDVVKIGSGVQHIEIADRVAGFTYVIF